MNWRLIDELTLPNGAYITNSYDNVARLTATCLENSTNAILEYYSYGYNQANQRTNVTRTAGDSVAYTYDNEGELKTALGKEPDGVTPRLQEQFGYAYDAAGNLNLRTNNALVQTFNVNTLNELTTATNSGTLTVAGTTTIPATNVTVNGLTAGLYADATFALGGFTVTNGLNAYTAIGKDALGDIATNSVTVNLPATNNYVYDLNGNLLSDGTRHFTYDDENELIGVWVTNAWQSQFVYDGFDRRVQILELSNSVPVSTNRFVWSGGQMCEERDGNNNVVKRFFPEGEQISGTSYYFTFDHLGSIREMTDGSGTIHARYDYDPYGKRSTNEITSSPVEADFGFTGYYVHQPSGLQLALYRAYDAGTGTWPNRDPLEEEGGGLNLYDYVANNPISKIDPLGLFGGDADANPGGVNNVPYMVITIDPCSGKSTVSNNDSGQLLAMLMGAGGGLVLGGGLIAGLAGPDEIAAEGGSLVYTLDEGEAVSGFVLQDGNVVFDDAALGHSTIAGQNGLLTDSIFPTLNQPAVGFTAVKEAGEISVFSSGMFPSSSATLNEVLPTILQTFK